MYIGLVWGHADSPTEGYSAYVTQLVLTQILRDSHW